MGAYSEKGHGGIYWAEDEKRGPSPLDLVRKAANGLPEFFLPALEKLRTLEHALLEEAVARVPQGWMTAVTREFTLALMCYNLRQLQKLLL